jgi:hypothetical protein
MYYGVSYLEEAGTFAISLFVRPHFGFELGNVLLLPFSRCLLLCATGSLLPKRKTDMIEKDGIGQSERFMIMLLSRSGRTRSASSSSRSCLPATASSFLDFRPGLGRGGRTHWVFCQPRDRTYMYTMPTVLLALTEVVTVTGPVGAAISARSSFRGFS